MKGAHAIRRVAGVRLASFAAIAGCCGAEADHRRLLRGPARLPVDATTTSVYQRWTRHAVVRHEIADDALEAWVTLKAWDFREAYVEHYASIYSLSDSDEAALRAAQLESWRDAYEFHVTAQSTNYKWNDLEKRSSAWRVTLVDGAGHELAPESVRLEKLPDPYEIEFFPAKGAVHAQLRDPLREAGARRRQGAGLRRPAHRQPDVAHRQPRRPPRADLAGQLT